MLVDKISNKGYILRELFNNIKIGHVDGTWERLWQQGLISFDKSTTLDNSNIEDIPAVLTKDI